MNKHSDYFLKVAFILSSGSSIPGTFLSLLLPEATLIKQIPSAIWDWGVTLVWQDYMRFRNSYIGLDGFFFYHSRWRLKAFVFPLNMASIPCLHKIFYFPETLFTDYGVWWEKCLSPKTLAQPSETNREFSYLGSQSTVPLHWLSLALLNQRLSLPWEPINSLCRSQGRQPLTYFYLSGIQLLMSMCLFIHIFCWQFAEK